MAFRKVTADYFKFKRALSSVEITQRSKLSQLLEQTKKSGFTAEYNLTEKAPWEEFKEKVPVNNYDSLSGKILNQMHNGTPELTDGKCRYYAQDFTLQGTIKYIPYTDTAINELEKAYSLIMANLYQKNSNSFKGKHFKPIPWQPDSLHHEAKLEENTTDSEKNWYKKKYNQHLQAVPETTASVSDYDSHCFAISAYLAACQDLTILTIGNPVYMLNLLDYLYNNRFEIANVFRTGTWGSRKKALASIPCPISSVLDVLALSEEYRSKKDLFDALWPDLRLISSWTSGKSKTFSRELTTLFPKALLVDAGLWATEGVVTIPYDDKFPLAVTSHFYEFLDLQTGNIHPAWDLKKGQELQPVISTGSGLFRYALNEKVVVTGFIKECPCFEHPGSFFNVNMAGEKMTSCIAQKTLSEISERFHLQALSIFAVQAGKENNARPFYMVICQGDNSEHSIKKIAEQAEEYLKRHLHYKLARDLNRLSPLRIVINPQARQLYREVAVIKYTVSCDYTIEPLVLWGPDDYDKYRNMLNI